MQCNNGHDNSPDMRFCGQCGEQLELAPQAARSAEEAASEQPTGLAPPPTEPLAQTEDNSGHEVAEPIEVGETETRSKKGWVIGAVAAAVLAVGGLAVLASGSSDSETPIEKAAEACGVMRNVGDDGSSISFDTEGEEDLSGDSISEVACVLTALEMPDRVISRIDQTRALDGTLDAEWGDYEAFWNYHPDNGMNMTVYEPE